MHRNTSNTYPTTMPPCTIVNHLYLKEKISCLSGEAITEFDCFISDCLVIGILFSSRWNQIIGVFSGEDLIEFYW